MKRYTLAFIPKNVSASPEQVKAEVEQVLLRLHPSITYRNWQAYHTLDGRLLVEIAVDGKRELVETALRKRVWKIPVQFEGMSWGWLVYNDEAAPHSEGLSTRDSDPLAGFTPATGQLVCVPRKKLLVLRYLSLIVTTLLVVAVLIADVLMTETPRLEILYLAVSFLWVFSMNEIPFDFRVYVKKITCGTEGLDVEYSFLWKPRQMRWQEITALETTNQVCTVSGAGRKMRFLLSERFGCAEKNTVLKTVITRAGLHYVEGTFVKHTYRKDEPADQHTVPVSV